MIVLQSNVYYVTFSAINPRELYNYRELKLKNKYENEKIQYMTPFRDFFVDHNYKFNPTFRITEDYKYVEVYILGTWIRLYKVDCISKKRIIEGDVLESGAELILHQVNCQGVMGSGVAKQVKDRFPKVYEAYKAYCKNVENPEELLGTVLFVSVGNNQTIANLFAQNKYGYDKTHTDYRALRLCLKTVALTHEEKSIAIPYKMSCDRGGGDWDRVSKMIHSELPSDNVRYYMYTGG